jgi:hypothetical protein
VIVIGRAARVIRFDHWWWSKLPPLMTVIYLELLQHSDQRQSVPLLIGGYATTIFLVAAYGHVINDAFDIRVDLLAGKPNGMANVTPLVRVALCVALALAAFVPSFILAFPPAAGACILLNLVWPTIYSVPPVRLKERGVLGIACDAAGSHVTPTLMAVAVFGVAHQDHVLPLLLTLWATALGIKGILHHELQDFGADTTAGVRTYITGGRFASVARAMPFYNLAVELPTSAALAIVALPYSFIPAISLALYCTLETIKYRRGFQFSLSPDPRTLRASIPFANELFYTAWLPLAAVIQLALSSSSWLWLVAAHIFTLNQQLRIAARDAFAVARVLVPGGGKRLRQYVRSRLV